MQHPIRKPLQAVLSAAALDGLERSVRRIYDRREEAARSRAPRERPSASTGAETAHQSVSVTRFPMSARQCRRRTAQRATHCSEGGRLYTTVPATHGLHPRTRLPASVVSYARVHNERVTWRAHCHHRPLPERKSPSLSLGNLPFVCRSW
jgi:hypothetical protein